MIKVRIIKLVSPALLFFISVFLVQFVGSTVMAQSATPSPSASASASASASSSASASASASVSPSSTPSPSSSVSPSSTPSPSSSVSPSSTPSPSSSASPTATPSVSVTPSPSVSSSVSPSANPSGSPTVSVSASVSASPAPSSTDEIIVELSADQSFRKQTGVFEASVSVDPVPEEDCTFRIRLAQGKIKKERVEFSDVLSSLIFVNATFKRKIQKVDGATPELNSLFRLICTKTYSSERYKFKPRSGAGKSSLATRAWIRRFLSKVKAS